MLQVTGPPRGEVSICCCYRVVIVIFQGCTESHVSLPVSKTRPVVGLILMTVLSVLMLASNVMLSLPLA
ncbi:MAG: hypothetical protein CM1200mP30_33280 [Pseudomonadota bacterium]|nr:MAG: hypothetical protein CM1200mP30_33280 [Pseudomonadota bacterium]